MVTSKSTINRYNEDDEDQTFFGRYNGDPEKREGDQSSACKAIFTNET